MNIDFIEIANFRKLRATRVGLAKKTTVFVGANNSGKTSAMVALRYFLVQSARSRFSLNDITLSHWPEIDRIGQQWELALQENQPLPAVDLIAMLPLLDVWLNVRDNEVHYVKDILPTLDWAGGSLGVRFQLQPKDPSKFQADYLAARAEAKALQAAEKQPAADGAPEEEVADLVEQVAQENESVASAGDAAQSPEIPIAEETEVPAAEAEQGGEAAPEGEAVIPVEVQAAVQASEAAQGQVQPAEPESSESEAATAALSAAAGAEAKAPEASPSPLTLWPESLTKFIERSIGRYFEVRAYVLDPAKLEDPAHGVAKPQVATSDPLQDDPLRGLIRINEISAQRGFGEAGVAEAVEDDGDSITSNSNARKLSEQLRRYYRRHLDPYQKPDAEDLAALRAIEEAQRAYDLRLKDGFGSALKEMEKLGYPGITDPRIHIATRLHPVDGLNHEAAVRYVMPMKETTGSVLTLPEDSNGLGYQNLISMVFRLMSYRDGWMRVGKA